MRSAVTTTAITLATGLLAASAAPAAVRALGEGTRFSVHSVAYDGGNTFPSAEGTSLNLDPDATNPYANDMGWNWCLSTAAPFTTEGDIGTPGAANTDC